MQAEIFYKLNTVYFCVKFWSSPLPPPDFLNDVELLQKCDIQIAVNVLCEVLLNLGLQSDKAVCSQQRERCVTK